MDLPIRVLVLGICATAAMDACAFALERAAAIPAPSYRFVGRWVGHMAAGRFRHPAIAKAPPVRAESWLGWAIHYAVGIAFAGLLVALCGEAWLREPTLGPAVVLGVGTLALPFLVMQPALGLGVAASKTPDPGAARLKSIFNHLLYGFGLYAAAAALSLLQAP